MRSTRNGYNLRIVHDLHDYLVSIGWTEQVSRLIVADLTIGYPRAPIRMPSRPAGPFLDVPYALI